MSYFITVAVPEDDKVVELVLGPLCGGTVSLDLRYLSGSKSACGKKEWYVYHDG